MLTRAGFVRCGFVRRAFVAALALAGFTLIGVARGAPNSLQLVPDDPDDVNPNRFGFCSCDPTTSTCDKNTMLCFATQVKTCCTSFPYTVPTCKTTIVADPFPPGCP